jgi:hypothetical protein
VVADVGRAPRHHRAPEVRCLWGAGAGEDKVGRGGTRAGRQARLVGRDGRTDGDDAALLCESRPRLCYT